MALTYLPTATANAAVGEVTGSWTYTGLNTGSPGQTGANEVTGGSYARQSTTWGSASAGVQSNSVAMNFTEMPSATIDYFSGWNEDSSGTYEAGGELTSSLTVASGDTVAVAIGALSVSISG